MKKLTFILFFISSFSYSQNWGLSLGYSSSNAVLGDLFYSIKQSSFHLGYTYKSNDARGKEVSEQKSNYGRTISGTGNYFYLSRLRLWIFYST